MIPKFYELIHPVLQLLSEEEHSRRSASQKLVAQFDLSDLKKALSLI